MKNALVLFLSLWSGAVFSCGGGWGNDYFYNLMDQESIPNKNFFPFLRVDDQTYYDQYSDVKFRLGNIKLWKELLSKCSLFKVEELIYSDDSLFIEKHYLDNDKLRNSINTYRQLAYSCAQVFNYRNNYSWYYEDYLKDEDIPDVSDLLEKANLLYGQEKNKQLKQRYLYQIIRMFHYTKQYEAAITFYTSEKRELKNELDYYLLDQIAGCYYSLDQKDRAAFYYSQVFHHSSDRKKSAATSYRFCLEQQKDGSSFIKTEEDKIGIILLKSYFSYDANTMKDVRDILAIDPQAEEAELLMMRSINNLERYYLADFNGISPTLKPDNGHLYFDRRTDVNFRTLLSEARSICELQSNVKSEKRSFWIKCNSFLHFLEGDFKKAITIIEKEKLPKNDELNNFNALYHLFQYQEITKENQATISFWIDQISTVNSSSAVKSICLEHIGHLYKNQGMYAQSFFCHNDIYDLENINSHILIESIEGFIHQEKNTLELNLFNYKVESKEDALNKLNRYAGLVYLKQANFKEADAHFGQSELAHIPFMDHRVFSNTTKEGCDFPTDSRMTDSVFLSKEFQFIPEKLSFKDLSYCLLKLDSMTYSTVLWKRKLSNYLLANYFYNNSAEGFFRQYLRFGESNWPAEYHSEFEESIEVVAGIEKRDYPFLSSSKIYNLKRVRDEQNSEFGYVFKAKQHYHKVMELSSDRELNARCVFLIARCSNDVEVYEMYNNQNIKKQMEGQYSEEFETLKTEYSDTEFHQQILEECSWYNAYFQL